jgi:enamine deaminase RidA (YjgF/YER057c/UK114 family)
MVEAAWLLAWRRSHGSRALDRAGGPDRRRRDEKGEYPSDMAAQVATALRRIIKLLGEAGAGPEHIVRLTWYLTSRSEYEAAGAGIGAAWRETLGRNFPPSTLLYIAGLVDARAKVEIEVTAFVTGA